MIEIKTITRLLIRLAVEAELTHGPLVGGLGVLVELINRIRPSMPIVTGDNLPI